MSRGLGDVYKRQVEIGGYATAISAVVTLFVLVSKAYLIFKKQERHQKENYMAILRITIVSEEMPLSERIAAGDKYVALGGNGQIKALYKKLIEQYEKENKK